MKNKSLIFLIAIANLVGFAYGIYYYSDQLSEWSPLFWVLIIDCPLQALFVGIAFLTFISVSGKKGPVFEFFTKLTSVGAIKYGIWTMFVILFYSSYFLAGEDWGMYSVLFFAHLGLLIEGLLLAGAYKIDFKDIALIGLFYLINDYSDYAIGTHPLIPNENIGLIAAFTVALTLISILVAKYCGETRAVKIDFISKYLFS